MSNTKKRVKVNAYSSWKDIFYDVPQESILGPLLFNIHLCDLFYLLEDLGIANYAGDTTIYTVNKKSQLLVLKKHLRCSLNQETSSSLLFEWFNNNFMKANSDKGHLVMGCKEATTQGLMVCLLNPIKKTSWE